MLKAEKIVAWVDYESMKKEAIMVKVGISAVDVEGAKNNLETEIPHWDFKLQRKKAKENWNKELAKIEVGEGKQKGRSQHILHRTLPHHDCS